MGQTAAKPIARLPLLWLSGALRISAQLLIAVGVFLLVMKGAHLFNDAQRFPALRGAMQLENRLERPLADILSAHLPTNFKGRDISEWAAIFLFYLLALVLGSLSAQAGLWAAALNNKAGGSDLLSELGGNVDRAKLLEIYTQAKKTLESQKRHLAFLSIDVVDSTKMKIGEDPGLAERDFRQYKHMVERCLNANNALKSTWTPDGVMVCFDNALDAVRAAQEVLLELGPFNRGIKSLKSDFNVRIGVNAGEVYYDAEVPLEEMSDRVIDIAGHMQKHGAVNAVCLAREAIAPYLKELPFTPAGRQVDGADVYEWRPQPQIQA